MTASLQSTLNEEAFSDIPDCWLTPDDVPEMEEIVRLIKHDAIFADTFFFQETNDPANGGEDGDGTYKPLLDYQVAAIEDIEDNFIIWMQGARGSTKSSLFARWVDGRCLRFPNTEVALFGPSFRQSKMLFGYCHQWLKDNFGVESHVYHLESEIEKDGIMVGNEPTIKFRNGSRIRAFPLGDGEKLRGLRANVLGIDEFYQFQKDMYELHIQPIGNVRLAGQPTKIVHMTTSWYTDCYAFSVLENIARHVGRGDKGYAIIDIDLGDVLRAGNLFDKAYILHQLEQQTDPTTGKLSDEALMTFFNHWIRSSGAFYSAQAIADCQRESLPVLEKMPKDDTAGWVAGVDPATCGSDKCAMSVYRCPGNDNRDLHAVYQYEKQRPEDIAGFIHKLVDRYPMIKLIVMDKSGAMGFNIADICSRETQVIDGQLEKRTPITLHDHPDARKARAHIILTKPSDERILHGISGPRYEGDAMDGGEMYLKNNIHLAMKRAIENSNFHFPKHVKDSDYYTSERGEIMDNIVEAIAQFPRIDRQRNNDGTFKTDNKGNFYFTKPSKDDGAYSVAYGNFACGIYYREQEGLRNTPSVSVSWEKIEEQQEETHQVVVAKLF